MKGITYHFDVIKDNVYGIVAYASNYKDGIGVKCAVFSRKDLLTNMAFFMKHNKVIKKFDAVIIDTGSQRNVYSPRDILKYLD